MELVNVNNIFVFHVCFLAVNIQPSLGDTTVDPRFCSVGLLQLFACLKPKDMVGSVRFQLRGQFIASVASRTTSPISTSSDATSCSRPSELNASKAAAARRVVSMFAFT